MIKKASLIFVISFFSALILQGQDLNLDDFDIFIGDTLINKTDYLNNEKNMSRERSKRLRFITITDGQKKIYYLNGQLSGQGEIKNKKENGFWTYWHENGQKAREGSFDEGKRTGTHTCWYPNGKLKEVGNFKNDRLDGMWTTYKEDGSEMAKQFYKDGEIVKQK